MNSKETPKANPTSPVRLTAGAREERDGDGDRVVSYRYRFIVSYLYRIRIVSRTIVSHRIVLYCIVSYRIVSYRIVSYRIVAEALTSAQMALLDDPAVMGYE